MASSGRLDEILGSHCHAGVWAPTCGSRVMETGGFGGWRHRGGGGRGFHEGGQCEAAPAGEGRGEHGVWVEGRDVGMGQRGWGWGRVIA